MRFDWRGLGNRIVARSEARALNVHSRAHLLNGSSPTSRLYLAIGQISGILHSPKRHLDSMVDLQKRHDDRQADSSSERPAKRARMSAEPTDESGRVASGEPVNSVNGAENNEEEEEETPYQEEARPSDLYLDTVCYIAVQLLHFS